MPTTFFSHNRIESQKVTLNSFSGSFEFQSWAETQAQYTSKMLPSWHAFLVDYFAESFYDYRFYQIRVWSYYLSLGDVQFSNMSYTCDTVSVSDAIVQAVTTPNHADLRVSCGGVWWEVRNQTLCVNCETFWSTSRQVPTADNVFFIPTPSQASPLTDIKYGVALQIGSRIKIPDSVPTLSVMSVIMTNQSATLMINASSSGYGGVTYCGAVPAGSSVSSVGVIKSQGFTTTTAVIEIYAIQYVSQVIVISGLVDSKLYDMYCYSEDSYGNGMHFDDMVATKVTATTLCCAGVVLTNTPEYVLMDPFALSDATDYEFTFSIGAEVVGANSVTVIPEITLVDTYSSASGLSIASIPEILVTPSSIRFTSQSQTLQGSFVLSATTEAIDRNFTFTLSVSGSSRHVFASNPVEFRAVSGGVVIPDPPSLRIARLLDNGKGATIHFKKAIDLIRAAALVQTDSWPCSAIFSFPGAAQTQCVIKNSTAVEMAFSSSSNILPRDTVILVAGKVFAACASVNRAVCTSSLYKSNALSSTRLQFPLAAMLPVPSLVMPTIIGGCDDLAIDTTLSTGHGGRPWKKIYWKVFSTDAAVNITGIRRVLNGITSTNSPFRIPSDVMVDAVKASDKGSQTFIFSLGLESYIQNLTASQVAYFSRNVVLDTSQFAPLTQIVGSSYRTIFKKDSLTLSASATVSTCASTAGTTSAASNIAYSWRVYSGGVYNASIKTASSNPRVMALNPYAVVGGKEYTFVCTASTKDGSSRASAIVFVAKSDVKIVVEGGTSRSVSPNTAYTIDASLSKDENVNPAIANQGSGLVFEWKCRYVSSNSNFGKDCTPSIACSSKICQLPKEIMLPREQLEISVRGVASDGRFDSKVISLTVNAELVKMSARVMYAKASPVFNANERLELSGQIQSNITSTAEWKLVTATSAVALTTPGMILTPTSRDLTVTSAAASGGISFPLKAEKNYFTPGKTYTFRLQVTSALDALSNVFSEISLTANGPPGNGNFQVIPSVGDAFSTFFEFIASSWVDDGNDYPLRYTFQYQLSVSDTDQRYLVKLNSESPYAVKPLPEGLSANGYDIFCIATIQDRYEASSTALWTVTSTLPNDIDIEQLSSNLTSELSSLIDNYDVDGVISAISTVGNLLGIKNCTGFGGSYCEATYNRGSCEAIDFTCGPCMNGFIGIAGSSNTKCYDPTSPNVNSTGDNCEPEHTTCLYGSCDATTRKCVADLQVCPTSDSELECSGNGLCRYLNGYGNEIERSECTTENAFCTPKCDCYEAYGGASCSLNASQVAVRETVRIDLCNSLVNISKFQDASADTLQSLVGPLSVAFEPGDFGINSTGFDSCGDVLLLIMDMVESGYIGQLDAHYSSFVAQLMSSFAGSSDVSGLYDLITGSIVSLTVGIDASMVPGEGNIDLTTASFRISFSFLFQDDVKNSTLQVPLTDMEKSRNASVTRLVLSGDGLGVCGASDGYNQFSVMQFAEGGNPYRNSTSMSSGLFRFTSSGSDSASTAGAASTSQSSFSFVTYFNEPQNFDGDNVTNATIPECVLLVTEGGLSSSSSTGYEQCNCNVTAYDSYSVTFTCVDVSSLCGGGSNARRLSSRNQDALSAFDSSYESASTPSDRLRVLSGGRFYSSDPRYAGQLVDKEHLQALASTQPVSHRPVSLATRRQLQAETGNTGAEGKSLTATQIGSIVVGAEGEFIDRLRSHPSITDLKQSTLALSYVGGMILMLVFGYIYFCYWDIHDRNIYRYLRFAEKRHKRKRSFRTRKDGSLKGLQKTLISREAGLNGLPVMEIQHSEDVCNDPSGQFVHEPDKNSVEYLVNQFLMATMSASGLITQKRALLRFWHANLRNHLWIRFLTYPSTFMPRSIRFLNLCTEILVIIFLDTLFYGYLYPDNTDSVHCQSFFNEADCTQEVINEFQGMTRCSWQIYENATAIHEYDYSNNLVMGVCDVTPPPQNLEIFVIFSVLINAIAIFPKALSLYLLNNVCNRQPDFDGSWLPQWFVDIFAYPVESDFKGTVKMSKLGESMLKVGTIERDEDDGLQENLSMLMDIIGQYRYYDAASVEEELDFIVRSVFDFVRSPPPMIDLAQIHNLDDDVALRLYEEEAMAAQVLRRDAVLNFMNLYPDCTPAPLSWQQTILYGPHHNNYLKVKLRKVREHCEEITESIETLAHDEHDNRDAMLVQHFILEQLPPIKRFALESEFFQFDMAKPRSVHWTTWMLGWTIQICMILFMLYWTLNWCVLVGEQYFKAWAYQSIFVLLEDIFIAQVLLVYLLHVMAIENMQAELRHIYHALKVIITDKCTRVVTDVEDGVRVVQHFSAVCRAARKEEVIDLPSSMLLTQLTDAEFDTCRIYRREKMTWAAFFAVGIPTLFGLFGETVQSVVFDVFASIFWGVYLLINKVAFQKSKYVLFAIYCLIAIVAVYYRYVILRSRHQAKARSDRFARDGGTTVVLRHHVKGWVKQKKNSLLSRSPVKMISNIFKAIAHKIKKTIFPKENRRKKLAWRNMNLVGALVLVPDRRQKHASRRQRHQPAHMTRSTHSINSEDDVSMNFRSRGGIRRGATDVSSVNSYRSGTSHRRASVSRRQNADSVRSAHQSAVFVRGFEDLRMIEDTRLRVDDGCDDDAGIPDDVSNMLVVTAAPKKTVISLANEAVKKPQTVVKHYYTKLTERMLIRTPQGGNSPLRIMRFAKDDASGAIANAQQSNQSTRLAKWKSDRAARLKSRDLFLEKCREKFRSEAVRCGLVNSKGEMLVGEDEADDLVVWAHSSFFASPTNLAKSTKHLFSNTRVLDYLTNTMTKYYEASSGDAGIEGVSEENFIQWIEHNNISDDPDYIPKHVVVIQKRSANKSDKFSEYFAPDVHKRKSESKRISVSDRLAYIDNDSVGISVGGSVGASVASNATPQIAGYNYDPNALSMRHSRMPPPIPPPIQSHTIPRNEIMSGPTDPNSASKERGPPAMPPSNRVGARGLLTALSSRRQASVGNSIGRLASGDSDMMMRPSSGSPTNSSASSPMFLTVHGSRRSVNGHDSQSPESDDDDSMAGGERLDIVSESNSSGDESDSSKSVVSVALVL
jgi:hypothetical protein